MKSPLILSCLVAILLSIAFPAFSPTLASDSAETLAVATWPDLSSETRPWAYWWWMGSAVNKEDLTRLFEQYQQAEMGGCHLIPIYGAKGYEDQFIEYLSPKWMEMLAHSVSDAKRFDLGIDMTTGTGWCFGGPTVRNHDANVKVVHKKFAVAEGKKLEEKMRSRRKRRRWWHIRRRGTIVDLTSKNRVRRHRRLGRAGRGLGRPRRLAGAVRDGASSGPRREAKATCSTRSTKTE